MTITPENLVRREVYYCVSSLVNTLAKAANGAISSPSGRNPYLDNAICETMYLSDQAFELASPIDDWEEAAREAGWNVVFHHGAGFRAIRNDAATDDDVTNYAASREDAAREACEANDIEPYQREVFEHWIVSDWLADRLAEKGEKVDKDFAGMIVWARTTTGQGIAADSVIEQICEEMNAA